MSRPSPARIRPTARAATASPNAVTTYIVTADPGHQGDADQGPRRGRVQGELPDRRYTCQWPEAQVFWDGRAVGPRIKLEQTACRAVATFDRRRAERGRGSHGLGAAPAARVACDTATEPGQVLGPPEADADAHRDADAATPTPTPTPTPSADTLAVAIGLPIAEPSNRPRPRLRRPSPTGEVLEATSPPEPTADSRSPSSSSALSRPPAATRTCRRSRASSAARRPIDPAVVGTNILLMTLLVCSCSA